MVEEAFSGLSLKDKSEYLMKGGHEEEWNLIHKLVMNVMFVG